MTSEPKNRKPEGPLFKIDLTAAEVVEIAVWLEKTATEFYRLLSESYEPGPLRDFFLGLTGMELDHERKMRDLLPTMGESSPGKLSFDEGLTGREYFIYLRSLAAKKVLPEGFEVFAMIDDFHEPADALPAALELEDKSGRLYRFLAEFRLSAEAEARVKQMIEEESRHLAEVRKIYRRFNAA